MLHGQLSAEIINTYYNEIGSSLVQDVKRYKQVKKAVRYAYKHECRIIDMAIPGEKLNGVSKSEYKEFVKYRLNVYLERLGCPPMFKIKKCSIIDWFEKNTYAYKVVDFFTPGMGMEYESSWDEPALVSAWTTIDEKEEINV